MATTMLLLEAAAAACVDLLQNSIHSVAREVERKVLLLFQWIILLLRIGRCSN